MLQMVTHHWAQLGHCHEQPHQQPINDLHASKSVQGAEERRGGQNRVGRRKNGVGMGQIVARKGDVLAAVLISYSPFLALICLPGSAWTYAHKGADADPSRPSGAENVPLLTGDLWECFCYRMQHTEWWCGCICGKVCCGDLAIILFLCPPTISPVYLNWQTVTYVNWISVTNSTSRSNWHQIPIIFTYIKINSCMIFTHGSVFFLHAPCRSYMRSLYGFVF